MDPGLEVGGPHRDPQALLLHLVEPFDASRPLELGPEVAVGAGPDLVDAVDVLDDVDRADAPAAVAVDQDAAVDADGHLLAELAAPPEVPEPGGDGPGVAAGPHGLPVDEDGPRAGRLALEAGQHGVLGVGQLAARGDHAEQRQVEDRPTAALGRLAGVEDAPAAQVQLPRPGLLAVAAQGDAEAAALAEHPEQRVRDMHWTTPLFVFRCRLTCPC